jgi:nucleoside-diphosphate-sugar epimerase
VARHVVFGTGQIGQPLVAQLVAAGHEVVAVNRSGRAGPSGLAGATVVGGDATDARFTIDVSQGATVVYFCLNAASYGRWDVEFPPLQDGVLAGAEAAGARLVALENLYAYGPTQGRPLVESLPARPTSHKARTRAAMTEQLLGAHDAGRVEVAIGRASDYFGPGARSSALGDGVFGRAVAGKRAQVMGDPDQPHSYSYTGDVATGLAVLGREPAAAGQVWHLPIAETRTTRQIVERVYTIADVRPQLLAAGRATLTLIGLVQPELRELRHTLYQFTDPWVVGDGKFRAAFGDHSTPLDDALAATVRWYDDAAAAQQS